MFRLRVKADQSPGSGNPEIAMLVFQQAQDKIGGEAIGGGIAGKIVGTPVVPAQAAFGGKPKPVAAVFKNTVYPVAAQAVFVFGIVAEIAAAVGLGIVI